MEGKAASELVERHLWIVAQFESRYHAFAPHADLHQAGVLGLVEAAARFRPEERRQFSTYAWNWVKGKMLSELRRAHVVPVPEHEARRANKEGTPIRGAIVFRAPEVPTDGEQEPASSRRMQLRAVKAATKAIPDPVMRYAVRRTLAGKSVREISQDVELTQREVQALLEAAGQLLAERLAG